MNILITGSAGFIGYHLVNQLLKTNHKIYGCDSLISKSVKTQKKRLKLLKKNKKFEFKKLDLRNYTKFCNYYKKKKINLIIHLAAQPGVRLSQENPLSTIDQNIKAFINILEFCKKEKIKHFFYASSSSVYGNSKKFKEKGVQLQVSSIYAASKLSDEIFASVYNYLYNINTLSLRFFTVYGSYGREDMAYYKFLEQIKKMKKIYIYGSKKSERSFTYIDDVTKSIELLIYKYTKLKKYNETFNIGNYRKNTLTDLIKNIKRFYSKNFREVIIQRNKADVLKTHSSTEKLKKSINYVPNTDLKIGIKKFVNWYKSQND